MSVVKRLFKVAVLVVVVALSVVGGFVYPNIRECLRHPGDLASVLSVLPLQMKIGLSSAMGDEAAAEGPLQMYQDTLYTVQSNYYGKLSDGRTLTYSAIRGMMASIGDRYTRFLDPTEYAKMQEDNQGEFVGIGTQLDVNPQNQVYVVKTLPNSPALHAHVMSGDIIAKVGDKTVLGMDITRVVTMIRGQPRTPVTLTLIRKGVEKPVVVTITRNYVHQEVVVSRMLDPQHKIGYISLAQFNEESDVQINKAMDQLQKQGMRALVFDLRGNPGGLLNIAQDVASRFVPAGPIVWVKEREGGMQSLNVENDKHNHPLYPLAVLVNDGSASASEITSGAIKDNGTGTLVGERTFGKGLVQTIIPLPDKSAVAITTAHYFTPAKHDINHKGIEPDVAVTLTDADEKAMNDYVNNHPDDPIDLANDRQLQKAVSVLIQKEQDGAKPHGWS
jgi:carboxyl-terminal processing protease